MSDSRELERTPGGAEGLSILDKKILQAAASGKSLIEIGNIVGTSPERAGQRVREILKSRDWLSGVEKKQLLIGDFYELRAYIMEMMEADRDPNEQRDSRGNVFIPPSDPRWSANMLVLNKELMRILEFEQKNNQKDIESIHQAHAKLMIRAIGIAFNRMVDGLMDKHPDLDPQELYDLLEAALPYAMDAVEERVTI